MCIQYLTNTIPANVTRADRKLRNKALEPLKPELTKIPKSPTYRDG